LQKKRSLRFVAQLHKDGSLQVMELGQGPQGSFQELLKERDARRGVKVALVIQPYPRRGAAIIPVFVVEGSLYKLGIGALHLFSLATLYA
jgi:hypothetical protein